jgi:undecaprenyl diphosphate synthase
MLRIRDFFSPTRGHDREQPVREPPVQAWALPHHVAIIMDGNGRWAAKRHLPRVAGHRAGVNALRRIVECCPDEGIKILSVYAFSTENWGRPREEVDALMRIFWETIKSDLQKLHRNGVRLRHLGRLEELAPDIQDAVRYSVDLTKNNDRVILNVCFNYGGRTELVDAIRQMLRDGIDPRDVNEELVSSYLYTRGLPDPDLIIRTASEMRLSNFLIWQAAYSEYYATPTLWPDFSRQDFIDAIRAYSQRQRRFGRLNNQASDTPLTAPADNTLAAESNEHGVIAPNKP